MSEDHTSIYERVLVAAREARRINDKQAMQHIVPLKKATTEAMERLKDDAIDYELEPGPRAASLDAEPFPSEDPPSWT